MRRSTWIALGLAAAAVVWMASGQFGDDRGPAPEARPEGEGAPLRVRVATFEAAEVERAVVVYGQTQAHRSVTVRAEAAGSVVEVPVARGRTVREGEVLVRLADEDRRERLAQAQALFRQRELEYEAAQSLKRQNLSAEQQLAAAAAQLDAARAELRAARLQLQWAGIRAPYDGILEERPVDVGDYLGVGDPAAVVVELDPLLARGHLAEQEVHRVRLGMTGTVRLADGREREATVTYLAATADPATRTFAVEMTLANAGAAIPAGMTASLRIPTETTVGHRLSAGLLTLNDAGEIGVKRVDDEGLVHFEPVQILRADADAIWVAGLPAVARLITSGQGFVRAGERVETVESES